MSLGLAGPAAAVTFDFGAGSNTENTIALNAGGIDLTVRGFTGFSDPVFTSTGVLGTAANINRNNAGNGWGVNGGGGGGLVGVGDALNLDFSPTSIVLLSALVFELDGEPDQFTIYNDQTAIGSINLPADPGADTFTLTDLGSLLSGSVVGSNFTIATNSGAIRLQSLTVTPVPLPPAALLLAAAFLGLFAVRKAAGSRA
ncbi:MAG: hypothetical protein AAGL24_11995 [Pseudomonadota bacterium]